MAYRAGDVRPGKCFVTSGDGRQVRRVKAVHSGAVCFEGREVSVHNGQWGSIVETSMEEFLCDAYREVGLDYTG